MLVKVIIAQMVEVAGEDHRFRLLEPDLKHLMPGRMPGCSEDADAPVAKYIESPLIMLVFAVL